MLCTVVVDFFFTKHGRKMTTMEKLVCLYAHSPKKKNIHVENMTNKEENMFFYVNVFISAVSKGYPIGFF